MNWPSPAPRCEHDKQETVKHEAVIGSDRTAEKKTGLWDDRGHINWSLGEDTHTQARHYLTQPR